MLKRLMIFILLGVVIIFSESKAQYQKVESHGLDIYYRVFGEGKPILVLSGGPGDVSDRVLGICELLSKSYRCILVDQRGTGRSSPAKYDSTTITMALTIDDFEAIRKGLGYKEWTVLGVSYGGYVGSAYAAFYPDAVSSLILVGSMGLNTDMFAYFGDNIMSRLQPSDIQLAEYWSDSARMAEDPQRAIVEQIRAKIPAYFYDRQKSLLVSQIMTVNDFNFEVGRWIFADIEKRNLELTKVGAHFGKPALIIQGRQDPVGEGVAYTLARFYENSKLVFIEKCGHYSWVEQPEKFFSAIEDFLPPGK